MEVFEGVELLAESESPDDAADESDDHGEECALSGAPPEVESAKDCGEETGGEDGAGKRGKFDDASGWEDGYDEYEG